MTKQFLIFALMLNVFSSITLAEPLKMTEDWVEASREAQVSLSPILVLYTTQACGYCERLKQDVLQPMFTHDPAHKSTVFREIDINAGGKMKDFNGDRIRSRQFKDRYQVFATPTLLILDRDGTLLTDPIVGYNSKEAYQTLLVSELEAYRLAHR